MKTTMMMMSKRRKRKRSGKEEEGEEERWINDVAMRADEILGKISNKSVREMIAADYIEALAYWAVGPDSMYDFFHECF